MMLRCSARSGGRADARQPCGPHRLAHPPSRSDRSPGWDEIPACTLATRDTVDLPESIPPFLAGISCPQWREWGPVTPLVLICRQRPRLRVWDGQGNSEDDF